MEDERLSILKMIETGRVTAEEGLRLLEALDAPRREAGEREPRPREPRNVRVLVTDLASGRRLSQAAVPVALVELALRLATRGASRSVSIGGKPVDAGLVLEAVRRGADGRILDLTNDEENVRVEVFLE